MGALAPAHGAAAAAVPKLVVLVVVDQMRGDELDCEGHDYRHGFAQLCREGRNYRRATLAHGITETASGHATLGTGLPPRDHGVLDKRLMHRKSGSLRDVCAYAPDANPCGNGSDGNGRAASPAEGGCNARALLVPTLGERLRQRRPASQVVAVAAKGRSANLLAGTNATLVAWTRGGAVPTLLGRSHAAGPLPRWLAEAWAAEPAAQPFVVWEAPKTRPAPAGSSGSRGPAADACPAAEACDCGHGPSFPHRLGQRAGPARAYDAWLASPQSDAATVAMALVARRQLRLGEGQGPDLLLVSLSAVDRLGHCFGPAGPERRAALAAVDKLLGDFLQQLRAAVPQGLVVALTADHGMMPRLSVAAAAGRKVGTLSTEEVDAAVAPALAPFGEASAGAASYSLRYPFVFLPPGPLLQDRAAATAQALARLPAVWRAWSATALLQDPHPVAQLLAASHRPDRGGEVVLALRPYHRPVATKPPWGGVVCGARHGSPWRYDRHVPLVVWGDGVRPGQLDEAVDLTQLGHTLANLLAISPALAQSLPLP